MSDIVKINNNEIPSDAKLFKVGEKTKTIYNLINSVNSTIDNL